ncbi:MAG: hypothetical protein LBE59_06020 [Nevskiaceae bacterium]|jgi:hypothetical protein|nr:hypothetical protein [Nevskiaceae bacterium]
MHRFIIQTISLTTLLFSSAILAAQGGGNAAPRYVPEDNRPPLAFREDFIDEPTETPVTMASINNKELRFTLWGPGKDLVAKSWHASPKDESGYIWTGSCTQVCGFTLYRPGYYLDLRELAKVTWRTKQTGFHQLRLMLKLADGQILVSDKTVGASRDWQVSEMPIADIQWYQLHTETMTDYPAVQNPDLSKVAEIGWTDLIPGSGHGTPGGSTRVDWIEVYGRLVPQNDAR